VPKLWSETVGAHRREVSDAILQTTMALVAEHGLLSVTMSQVAEATGIGRATLYKYFPDVEAILVAWHERQISAHLEQLAGIAGRAGGAGERLEAVLTTYALLSQEIHGTDLSGLLHRGDHVAHAHRHLHDLVRRLLTEAAETGDIRSDVSADELASYCIHALSAARSLRSKAATRRLVTVVLAGLMFDAHGRGRSGVGVVRSDLAAYRRVPPAAAEVEVALPTETRDLDDTTDWEGLHADDQRD
jgi:AcrR family transcriptional regulator